MTGLYANLNSNETARALSVVLVDAMNRSHTMDEAAGLLRISRRCFQDIVQRHPFYYVNGRRKLFTDEDIVAIVDGLRHEAEADRLPRLKLSPRGADKRYVRAAPTTSALTELQVLLAKSTRKTTQR